jgi:predicted nucleic acid-binding Zn ribbon protein
MRLTVKAVIAGQCHSHGRGGPLGVANWCVRKDAVCPIFATFRRCEWFETAVLPDCPDVAAEYAALAGQNRSGEPVVTRQAICRNCGEAFKALYNRQQYCSEECRHQGRKDYERRYKRGKRAPVSGAV